MKAPNISIEDRIKIYTAAISSLKRNWNRKYPIGWCYALCNNKFFLVMGSYSEYSPFDPDDFKLLFPDLLVYAKKKLARSEYLFPLNKKGQDHRIAVLEYRITELKEQLKNKL